MKLSYGLLGKTLGHSWSPQLHSHFADYKYELLPVSEEECRNIISSKNFLGLNVTIPYKELAFELCDELSETAREAGCVNTVVIRNGRIYGDNTDVFGFLYMLKRGGISLSGKNVIILGSGGTSKTATVAAKHEGARKITVVSRRGEINYENVYSLSDTEIIINTTPVGMYPHNGTAAVDISRFPKCEGVCDVIYNPAKTKLLLDAEALGIPHVGGLYMLAAQAARASEVFTKNSVADELIEKAVGSVRRETQNIVLIGMPGCGKSTIAKLLSEKICRPLVDTDEEITKRFGRTPSDIINEDGEDYFRSLEIQVVADSGRESGKIISTGGGVCEREENIASLSQNGTVFLISRDLASLDTKNRPLSTNLAALYEKRRDKYLRMADFVVESNSSPDAAAKKVLSSFFDF